MNWGLWGAPILIGCVIGVGLISALLDDGVWDALSWILLSIPLIVIGWFWRRA